MASWALGQTVSRSAVGPAIREARSGRRFSCPRSSGRWGGGVRVRACLAISMRSLSLSILGISAAASSETLDDISMAFVGSRAKAGASRGNAVARSPNPPSIPPRKKEVSRCLLYSDLQEHGFLSENPRKCATGVRSAKLIPPSNQSEDFGVLRIARQEPRQTKMSTIVGVWR